MFGKTTLVLTILALLLSVFFAGCDDPVDANIDPIYTIEDLSQSSDFATLAIDMMNKIRSDVDKASAYLGSNRQGVAFSEAVPSGWHLTEYDSSWYERTYGDHFFEVIRFDHGITFPFDVYPVKVDYMQIETANTESYRYSITTDGDSISLNYSDFYVNLSELEGEGSYYRGKRLFRENPYHNHETSSTFMQNTWQYSLTGLSSVPGRPEGTYRGEGRSSQSFADFRNSDWIVPCLQIVEYEFLISSHGTGEGVLLVDGIERVRFDFTGFDTEFHGYYSLNDDNFRKRVQF